MTLHLDHATVRGAAADLHRAAGSLHEEQARADARVELLLDGGWQGRSAGSYAEAWAVWRRGCDDVVRGLAAMAQLLAALDQDLTERDEESQAHLDSVSARILERLS